jgi:tRNA(Ile)-lysidine synthase
MSRPARYADFEIDQLLAPLATYQRVLLAVSGGPDSMALMGFAASWRSRQGDAPLMEVVTVDHGLRPESRREAETVAASARQLGLPHRLLSWNAGPVRSAVQEAARAARYELLLSLARTAPVVRTAIVTAHTRDDQAETVVMRLARGSGVDGLAAMRAQRQLSAEGPVDLLRPLLDQSKSDLMAWLSDNGMAWVTDPSNSDCRFERGRLRRLQPALEEAGLTAQALALSARRLARARAALEAATDELMRAAVDVHSGAFAEVRMEPFMEAPEEFRVRLLARLIRAFGGAGTDIQLSQIEVLEQSLQARPERTRTTLGGCLIEPRRLFVRIFREVGRAGLPDVRIEPGQAINWDNRFEVCVRGDPRREFETASGRLSIRALSPAEFANLRRINPECARVPTLAALTLPGLWRDDTLLAAPLLCPVGLNAKSGVRHNQDSALRFETRFLALARHPDLRVRAPLREVSAVSPAPR